MNNIVLTMTSYGERLKTLHSYLWWVPYVPFTFNLYVGNEEVLPQELLNFFEHTKNAKLHIVEDIGPLTKSYYALQEYPDDVLFIIDDDLRYTPEWIMFAIDSYCVHSPSFRDCVIGLVARKVLLTPNMDLEIMQFGKDQTPYQQTFNYFTGHSLPLQKSFKNLILSGSPGSFLNIRQLHEDYFDKDLYNSISRSQDEMWNWCQSIRLGYKHVGLHTSRISIPAYPETIASSLNINFNTVEHERDIFRKYMEKYPEILKLVILD